MWKQMKPADRAIWLVLSSMYAVLFLFFYVPELLSGEIHPQFLQVREAQAPDAYPIATQVGSSAGFIARNLHIGDALVEIDGHAMAGAGRLRTLITAASSPDADGQFPVTVIRDGRRLELVVEVMPAWGWFSFLLPLTFGIAGMLAYLGARGAEHARYFFFTCLAFGAHMMTIDSPSHFVSGMGLATTMVGGLLLGPLAILALQRFPADHPPLSRWSRTWPWIFLVSGVGYASAIHGYPFDATWGVPVSMLGNVAVAGVGMFLVVRGYLRAGPAGRRQVFWIGLGICLGITPTLVMSGVTLVEPSLLPAFYAANISFIAIPICFIIAIIGYGAFDVDRIVAATLSFGVALCALVGVTLLFARPASSLLAGRLALTEEAAYAGVIVALAFGVIPVARALRPRFFARFFPGRARMRSTLDHVLGGFAECVSENELIDALQDGLASLFSPSWQLAVVETDDGTAQLLDTRPDGTARIAPADLGALGVAHSPVRIERRGGGLRRSRALTLDARERLDEAGAAVGVPIHVPDHPSWTWVLGVKDTGDLYPPNELESLAEVAGRVALELMRIRAADLTIQNRAERAIHVARSKFLAATSHDLRQPLHSFGLHLGALATEALTPNAQRILGQLEGSLDELQQQFESVLQVSKLDAGVVAPKTGPLPLGPMLESLGASLSPVAASRNLSFSTDEVDEWIESDPLLLGRILRNLAENALRYTIEGGVSIAVEHRGPSVRIAVRDTGPGITQEERERIFAEFERGTPREAATAPGATDAPEGLGLGLSIVDRLARLLGHEIGLESAAGEGSVFWIELPRCEAPPQALTTSPLSPAVPSELDGASVWLVDDEASVLDGLVSLLGAWGCETRPARSGGEALSLLESTDRTPDVVIVDDQLGAETGTDVVEALLDELAPGASPPQFIFVTGNTDPNRLAELSAIGYPVLNKPVPVMRLRAALAHALVSQAGRGAAQAD